MSRKVKQSSILNPYFNIPNSNCIFGANAITLSYCRELEDSEIRENTWILIFVEERKGYQYRPKLFRFKKIIEIKEKSQELS